MKKVIGLTIAFLVMVTMVLTMANVYAEEITYGIYDSEAEELINEWATAQGLDDWVIHNDVNGVMHYTGGLCIDYFENDNKITWSMENWIDVSKSEYDMTSIWVRRVGEIEGHDVYRVNAESKKTLGNVNGKDYYKADIVFIVYTHESKEAYMEGKANSQKTIYWE